MVNNQIYLDNKLDLDPDVLKKARNGDDAAQLKIGKTLFNSGNSTNAINWFLQSAKQGNMEAQFRLADLYALGQGTQKSQEDAYQWYTRAALQGYNKALIRIQNLYQQDKRMSCRGQLNSSEDEWIYEGFQKKHNIRELNEYRREKHASILNNAVDYYTQKFKQYKSSNQESVESDLYLAFFYHYGYGTRKNMLLAFDFYKKAAEQGHKDAQYGLANLYQSNPNMKFNYRLALRWYRASATNGNIAAQNCLAYFYEKGLATELNYEGALYWYMKAANSGNSRAQLTLGRLYRKGQGVEQRLSEAIKWYKLAAHQGNSAAQNCLNQLYLAGKTPSVENDDSVSQSLVSFTLRSKLQKDIANLHNYIHINELKKLAQHAFMTDGHAMYQIGLKYYNGEGFLQDKDAGFQWIKKAAKAGLVEAELKIAKMYECGDAADNDYHRSSLWIMKAAKKRNSTALLNLGTFYKYGVGVRKDPLEASKWFTMSAERGNTHAQFHFGLLRYYGEGVRKNKEEAFEYFYKAALFRNSDALYQLGWMHENNGFVGIDIFKVLKLYKPTETAKGYDPDDAIKFYKLAATLGHQDAQFRLAKIYEEGELLKQDLVKAHEYYIMAANSSNSDYQTELALKYINGDCNDAIYTKTFELFTRAAEKNEPRANRIFQIPIQPSDDINDYSQVIKMFILVSTRGIKGMQYNIGHAYEHGIMIKDRILFRKDYSESKRWYSIAAGMGDLRAKYRIDVVYEEGKSTEKYLDIACNSYSLAFENGNNDVAYSLGLMYLRGGHVSQDFEKAFNLFTAASNMGHKEARNKIVLNEYSPSETIEMLKSVATSGNVAVQYQLAIYFEHENYSTQIKWLTMAAEGGVNDAYYRLGVLYEERRGTPSDCLKAINLYQKAAKEDHENAIFRLAHMYQHGKGTKCDFMKAYDLYTTAANLGHQGALEVLNINGKESPIAHEMFNKKHFSSSNKLNSNISMAEFVATRGDIGLQFKLGYFYENNKSNQNYIKAFQWYTMAADKNHTEATYRLGVLNENGLGTKKNYSVSINLYNKAKDQGSRDALYRLGVAFHCGYGVDINPAKAVNYYTNAAKLGSHEAQYTLGKLYETGELVERDVIKALVLYTKAYTQGNDNVKSSLYGLYDEKCYKYFGQKLFRKLSMIEWPEKRETVDDDDDINYGFIYYILGRMYLKGIGTTKSDKEALKHFLIAENQYGYSDAKPFTQFTYDKKKEEKDVYTQRMKAYFEIRNTLNAEQQYQIGMIYYEDAMYYYEDSETAKYNFDDEYHEEAQLKKKVTAPLLVKSIEDDTAYQYLLLAANKNHRKAQSQLVIMYLSGYIVKQDEKIALKWLKKYVEVVKPNQCYKLGMYYYDGNRAIQNYKISLVYIKKAAEENHHRAMFQLGMMYWYENGVEKDQAEQDQIKQDQTEQYQAEARQWIQKSIENMSEEQCYEQGMEFYQGTKVNRNYDIALLYINQAAEKNFSEAQIQLGIMYLHGYGVEKNQEEAMKWILQSANRISVDECYEWGIDFFQGNKVDKNYDIALLYTKKAAERNHKKAQAQLGVIYWHGHGVEQDQAESMKWIKKSIKKMTEYECYEWGMKFCQDANVNKNYDIALLYLKKSAEKNHGGAQVQLGIMYLHGYGVEKNQEEAMKWILQSTKQMHGYRCYKQGMEFYSGNEIERNYEFAFLYIKKAAEEYNSEAQTQLGIMYLNGYGVEEDLKEAVRWIQQSIKKMSGNEYYERGLRFYHGIVAKKSYEISLLYIKKAAEENHNEAQVQLGLMYYHGYGVEQRYEKAVEWFKKAANNMVDYDLYRLGMKFYKDTDIEDAIALIYLEKAAKKKHEKGQAQLALAYSKDREFDEVIECIELSVKTMSLCNCYNYGIQFFNYNKDGQHYKYSLRYFGKAAKKAYIYSQAQLGRMYLHGYGVNQDKVEAALWYEQAVGKKSSHPAYKIGQIYHYDSDGIQDFSKAIEQYNKELEEGELRQALHGIGLLYEYGDGVDQDYQKALHYYERAAATEDSGGYYNLALLYYYGRGVDQDYDKAFSFFARVTDNSFDENMYVFIESRDVYSKTGTVESRSRKYSIQSIDKIIGESYYHIGLMYKNGQGTVQNRNQARINFEFAFEFGNESVKRFLK